MVIAAAAAAADSRSLVTTDLIRLEFVECRYDAAVTSDDIHRRRELLTKARSTHSLRILVGLRMIDTQYIGIGRGLGRISVSPG